MTTQEIATKLHDTFGFISFQEKGHKYFFDGQSDDAIISVTGLVETLHAPFDKDYWSEFKAKKLGVSKEDILKEWDDKTLLACDRGTAVHRFMECFYTGQKYVIPEEVNRPEIVEAVNRNKPACKKFILDYNDVFEPVASELKVGVREWKLCGTIDQIFREKSTGNLWIYDWKTNKEFTTKNKYGSMLQAPFNRYEDCNLNAYSFQLNIYKKIIEKMTDLKIAGCVLVWFDETGEYHPFRCLDVANDCDILLRRRVRELEEQSDN